MDEVIKYEANEKTLLINLLIKLMFKPISNSLKLREMNKLLREYNDKYQPKWK